tara:strand:- start:8526 stop:9017 length:492 start_codon:yes stop_codon:yes gene_type:complete
MNKLLNVKNLIEKKGLILKIQIRRFWGLSFFRIIIAELITPDRIQIWGEIKGWNYPRKTGLQLDTMRVMKNAPSGVGMMIWASVAAWTLTETSSKEARLLAIYDNEGSNQKLTRYFRKTGFVKIKEVGSTPSDLFLRIVWGGAGTLMKGSCDQIYQDSIKNII